MVEAGSKNGKNSVRLVDTKRGVSQGTKLGVILFTVMTNKLLSDQRLRIKYDDDNSALEIIPRNSTSLLNIVRHSVLPCLII